MKNLNNKVVYGFISVLLVFFILINNFQLRSLIIVLNGLTFGCFFAIVNAYWKLFWSAFTNNGRQYDQIRQMTLSVMLQWMIIFGSIWTSFQNKALGIEIPASSMTVFIRLFTVIAAVLQVTAPDFGLGFFHGRDRKVLWASVAFGTIVAVAAIYIQVNSLLGWFAT